MKPGLTVRFFRTPSGSEPVREWLKELDGASRKSIGADLKTVQLGWPLGMPLVRKLAPGLWESRSHIPQGIARVLFTMNGETLVLLHGLIKKSQKTPPSDLETAIRRMKEIVNEH